MFPHMSLLAILASTLLNVSVQIHFTPGANLAYQLDCVSGAIQACGRADFGTLWRERFLRTAADSAQLVAWGALRRRYDVTATVERTTNGRVEREHVALGDKLRIATLQATSVDDLTQRLETFLRPADWLVARAVVQHFREPFDAWWQTEAAPRGEPFRAKLEALLARDDVRATIGRFAAFYGTVFPADAGVPMQLVMRPGQVPWPTSGQQIERHAVLEFLPNEDPARRIDVAVHELCHFFFNTRDPAKERALTERLRTSRSPAAMAAGNLFNEALATALGSALLVRQLTDSARWQRMLATPMSFYANPYIDKAARVLLPIVEKRVAAGGTIDDPAFATEYIAGIDSAFGAAVTAPALLLNELYLYSDDALGDAILGQARNALRPSSVYAMRAPAKTAQFDDFRQRDRLNALFVLTPKAVDELGSRQQLPPDAVKTLHRAARDMKEPSFVHVARRPSGAWWFIIIARDAAAADAALARLARRPSALVDAPSPPAAPKS